MYRIYNGKLQNLIMHDNLREKWFVDTRDLSEPITRIYEEYDVLNRR